MNFRHFTTEPGELAIGDCLDAEMFHVARLFGMDAMVVCSEMPPGAVLVQPETVLANGLAILDMYGLAPSTVKIEWIETTGFKVHRLEANCEDNLNWRTVILDPRTILESCKTTLKWAERQDLSKVGNWRGMEGPVFGKVIERIRGGYEMFQQTHPGL